MTDKSLNYRQSLYVTYFTSDEECKGNAYKSAIKAGYTKRTSQRAPEQLSRNIKIKKAIESSLKDLKVLWKDRLLKVITRLQTELDKTTSISSLCLLVNAQKGYMDMQAKNEGQYGLDNAQQAEKLQLDERQLVEARRIALVLLTMPPEVIKVDSKVIEGDKDVQGQGQAERG